MMHRINLRKLKQQILKFRLRDVWPLILLCLSFVPGLFFRKLFPDTWVVTEYENDARDNGYWFFKYVREHHPEQRIYYPINYNSSDFEKVSKLGKTVKFGSFRHYVLFWGCAKFIGTTKYYGLPYGRICDDLVFWNIPHFKYIFLNHGVARGYSSIVDANETNYSLIISMSKMEKKIIIEENGQNPDIIKTIGFCRHDNLNDSQLNHKLILIMPTWRNWLDSRLEIDKHIKDQVTLKFLKSSYYKCWKEILNDEYFEKFLEENDLYVKFYIHEYAEKYLKYFKTSNPRIIMVKKEGNYVQDLLKEAAVLITDYSSVSYDFAYMKKPVFYYQFDLKEFEAKQYAQGKYFSYKRNAFGKIAYDKETLMRQLKENYESKFKMPAMYKSRVNSFFAYHDTQNCKRNYDAVKNV